jgi:hypothetical protein
VQEWMPWLKTVYIPEVMASGFFTDSKILRLLSEAQENGFTYAVQFTMPSATYVDKIDEDFYLAYDRMPSKKFGDKVLFFRTVLELVN